MTGGWKNGLNFSPAAAENLEPTSQMTFTEESPIAYSNTVSPKSRVMFSCNEFEQIKLSEGVSAVNVSINTETNDHSVKI